MSKAACDELLVVMEGHDSSAKIEGLHGMKQSIKKESIENQAVRPLFQALKLGLANSNSQVSGQALTTTHGALRRLDIQDTNLLKVALPTILALLIDRLGDVPDKVPQLARDCLAIAWRSSQAEVEGAIKQLGFGHRISKVREQSIRWTARSALDKNVKLNFRSFTSYLITALEDSDGTVREASKQTVVELFLTVPPHARADLRREMSIQNVRKSTMQQIVSQLDMPDGPEINLSKSTNSLPEEMQVQARTNRRIITPTSHAEGSIAGSMASTYIGSVPGSEMEAMESATIYSARDLEQELAAMLPCFEGRESEKNWLNREKSLNRLRSILRGNAVRDHNVVLVTGLKALLEGIIKGMTSLRTSLCLIGLQFAKDLCIVLGPGADQFVEQLLGTLVKLTGATKKIQAQAANVTTNVLLVSVSYHARLLQHLSLAIQDKNVAPRLYTTSWLRLLLEAHGDSKAQIEHAGIDALDRSVRKGLLDANPGVREGMRLTYWIYVSIWPEKANAILSTLDSTAKKQLEKANPSAAISADKTELIDRPPHTRGLSVSRPAIKTLVQIERARAAQPSIDMIALPKSAPISAPVEQSRPELKSSLSSGPQRQALGGAVRPAASRKPTTTRAEDTLRSSVRSTSSQTATNPSNASPLRTEQMFSPRRRKPITEQLESENWKTRVEGVITLACLLANKEPPNTDGQKITLPSTETLAPILRKLMADSQAEVVDHLMAPEVIAEIAKIIEWDCILPRVLLMAETDESEVGHDVKSDCLPAVKSMFTPTAAVHQCLDTLALLKVAGHLGKPIKPNFRFTTAQKRPIIKAVLIWLTELIQDHQNAVDRGVAGNSAFSETSEYKLVMNRTMSMMTNIQPSSMNYSPLATFLKALRKSDEPTFDKNLDTFERPVIIALKKAWGEKPIEEADGLDEPIADVQSVLGAVPVVQSVSAEDVPVNMSPETSMESSLSAPITPSQNPAIDVSVYGSNSSMVNGHEDMTMLPSMFAPKTPAGFRQALHMVDSPWSPNGSPTKTIDGSDHEVEKLKLENLELGQLKGEKENISIFQDATKIAGTDVWYRKQMRSQSSATPLPKSAEDKIRMIDILVARLDQGDLDASGFRKLVRIVREHPTVRSPETDAASEQHDIWHAGAKIDHLIKLLLKSLDVENDDMDAKVQAVLLIKNCLENQPQYFAGHQSSTISSIFTVRSTGNSKSLAAGLEDLCLELISAVEPKSGIITVLQSLQTYVVDDEAAWKTERLPSLQLALKSLAIAVSHLTIKALEGFAQALSQLIVKTLNDEFVGPDVEIAEIRRNTVNLCMAMYSVIGDTRTVLTLLRDLKPSQQNLLTYYFANKPTES